MLAIAHDHKALCHFRYIANLWYKFCFSRTIDAVYMRKFQKGRWRTAASHMVLVLVGTLIISAITGAVVSSEGAFFLGPTGQVLHGLLSIVCFTLVGVAFWRFGWKVGVIDLVFLFIAGNAAFSFCGRLTKH